MDRICHATATRIAFFGAAALPTLWMLSPDAAAQVRTDAPDRGVYQSPQLGSPAAGASVASTEPSGIEQRAARPLPPASVQRDPSTLAQRRVAPVRHSTETRHRQAADGDREPRSRYQRSLQGLIDAEIEPIGSAPATPAPPPSRHRRREARSTAPAAAPRAIQRTSDSGHREASAPRRHDAALQAVAHDEVVLVPPHRDVALPAHPVDQAPTGHPGPPGYPGEGAVFDEPTCDAAFGGSVACDAMGCDTPGCDRCDRCWWDPWTGGEICWTPDRWFGSAELLLMFRNGDHLPPLVTTGPASDPETAGQLGEADTRVLAGGDKRLDGMTAGGRITIGTWLDARECRSLVLRGWMAGDETYGFHTDHNETPVIARPFFNVSDDQTAEQDTQLVALPGRSSGSIDVHAESNVLGGDVSVRQFWYGRHGATVDFLYGYQYMRLDEQLQVSSTSTSRDADFAPLGSVLSITDDFDTENEFHGGQFGIASRYREGCWSFDGLVKFGFGSLRRTADRRGMTRTSVDAATATTAEGLLVRSTNRGTTRDHTFGWVPELDLSLGWHRYPRFDVTCGYHLIAMTDALQVSGAIDPALGVNLADPPSGAQRPAPGLRYDTFYVHGIHFGLKYVY